MIAVDANRDGVIKFAKPGDLQWNDLDEKQVILFDDLIRIKIRITPRFNSLSEILAVFGFSNVKIKTLGTRPGGTDFVLTAQNSTFVSGADYCEIRLELTRQQLKNLGVLPANENDGVEEKVWFDEPSATTGNLSDSTAYGITMPGVLRGRCSPSPENGTLESNPPNAPIDKTFVVAAGSEVISAEYHGVSSNKSQVANQADSFYYSGHGSADGTLTSGSITVQPQDVKWTKDLDVVIIAGCSVLNIGNYDGQALIIPAPGQPWPGQQWQATGPRFFLGYRLAAPGDIGGAPARIVADYAHNFVAQGYAPAWMNANKTNRAWNSCAIEKDATYYYFHFIPRLGGIFYDHELRSIPKSSW